MRVYEKRNGGKLPVIQQRAATCELCRNINGTPSCVYACPRYAAFRMSGEELFAKTRSEIWDSGC